MEKRSYQQECLYRHHGSVASKSSLILEFKARQCSACNPTRTAWQALLGQPVLTDTFVLSSNNIRYLKTVDLNESSPKSYGTAACRQMEKKIEKGKKNICLLYYYFRSFVRLSKKHWFFGLRSRWLHLHRWHVSTGCRHCFLTMHLANLRFCLFDACDLSTIVLRMVCI